MTIFPLLAACLLAAMSPSDGGVTYDFAAITERCFPIPKIGDAGNLVDGEEFFDDPWGEGRKAWGKYVTLPTAAGARFKLSFRYKMRHTKGELGYAFIFYYNRDPATGAYRLREDVKASYSSYDVWVLKNEWADWNRFSKEFTAPAGPDAVKIVIRIDGRGDLEFADPSLLCVDAAAKRPASVSFFPQSRLDGVYRLSEGQCGLLRLSFVNSGIGKVDPRTCDFALDLPPCATFLGATFDARKTLVTERLADGGTRTRFHAAPDAFRATCENATLLVGAAGTVGASGSATLTVTQEGRLVSDPANLRLEIVPAVRAVRPKRYANGVFFYQREALFKNDAADRAFAALMGDAGVGWVICNAKTEEQLALWRAAGIGRITPQVVIDNGYHLGNGAGRPAGDAFVRDKNAGGAKTWDRYMDNSTCPLAVIEERPYFLSNTVAQLTRALKGCDGLWANWEPFMYKGKGCCCAKCRAAFGTWHAAHPEGTLSDFRSILHGKMVRVLDRYVRRATGMEKSVGFLPGISWRETASSWRAMNPSAESKPIDYAGDFEWIEPWGPYCFWDTTIPYIYQKRGPLAHFVAAKDIREQVDRDFPLPKRPKLMAFPNSVQGNWISQPEWIEMAMDSFFFNRWEATVLYFFPEGYDARYWRAFAAATTRAARYERFVLDGVRCDDKTALGPVAAYARPSGYVTTYLPSCENVPMLQQASYRLGGTHLVALFNFWEKGAAYLRLCVRDLPEARYAVTDDTGARYASAAPDGCWTSAEIASGVLVRVGAARTRVFEIGAGGANAKRDLSEASLMERYRAELPAIAAAAEEDARYEAANTVRRTDTQGEL